MSASYRENLVAFGESVGFNVRPDLQSFHDLLTKYGWTPRLDVLRRSQKQRVARRVGVRDLRRKSRRPPKRYVIVQRAWRTDVY